MFLFAYFFESVFFFKSLSKSMQNSKKKTFFLLRKAIRKNSITVSYKEQNFPYVYVEMLVSFDLLK